MKKADRVKKEREEAARKTQAALEQVHHTPRATTNPHNLGKSKKSKTPNPLGGRRNPTAFKGGFGALFPDLPRL